jgi:hypothetical protein
MAISAQSLADTLTMSEEQITQGSNFANGELYEYYYKEMENKIGDEEFVDKDLRDYDGEYKDELLKAIQAEYGSTAVLGEDGKVHYKGADGNE